MKLTDAILLACSAHDGQTDKAGEPYILHPLRVMQAMTTKTDRIVAVLHDVAEDVEYGWDLIHGGEFSDEVVDAVDALTRREGESYEDFIQRCAANPIARRVKLADIADNLSPSRSGSITDILRQRYEAGRAALEQDTER